MCVACVEARDFDNLTFMAQYENLPIYKQAMDLAVYVEKIVAGFSRYNKYTLGAEMRVLAHRILVLISKANTQQEKGPVLLELREKLEELKILARISMELRAFAKLNSFEYLVKTVVELARQNEGWLRSQKPRPCADGERACVHGAPRPPGQ